MVAAECAISGPSVACPTPGAAIRIETSNLETLHAELAGKSYKYARPGLDERPWGEEMSVKDPFGNRLTFASSRAK